jgi:hypothetical protein
MPYINTVSNILEPEAALNEIELYTKQAADAAGSYLSQANIEDYKHFLDTMYHYTRNTGEKAKEAADNVSQEELKEFFLHFVKEEAWHYKLALHDLKHFDLMPSPKKPQAVQEFDEYWASLKGSHSNWYLGALYVFENIVKYVGNDVRAFVKRLDLKKDQARWLLEHAEADMEHGEEVAAMLKKHIADNPVAAAHSAKEASRLWINIMGVALNAKKAA